MHMGTTPVDNPAGLYTLRHSAQESTVVHMDADLEAQYREVIREALLLAARPDVPRQNKLDVAVRCGAIAREFPQLRSRAYRARRELRRKS